MGKVVSVSFKNDNTLAAVTVAGNYKNYSIKLQFNLSGELEEYECNCQSGSIWQGACKHIIAALLAVFEVKNQPAMVRIAQKLSNNLVNQIYQEIDENIETKAGNASDSHKLRLKPKLSFDANKKPYLNFYVGNSKMYIIKNINDFITNIKKQAVASYGSKLRFKHLVSVFDNESQDLLEFIMNENEIYFEVSKSIMENYNYMYMARENARNLSLNTRNSDSFFELFINKTMDSDIGVINVVDQPPSISFEVESKPDEIVLKGENLSFLTIDGKKYKYILAENIIYRTDKNRGAILTEIADSLNMSETPEIVFKDNERIKFISVILPYLNRERFISKIDGEMESAQSIPMSPKLYFSVNGGDVFCRAAFYYGNIEINPIKQQETVVARDMPYEYSIIRNLGMYGFEPDENDGVYKLSDSDAIYRLLYDGMEDLKNKAQIYVSNELTHQKPRAVKSKLGVSLSGDLLELSLEDSEYSFNDLIETLDSLRLKKKYHRLKNGRFVNLEDKHIQAITQIISSLDLTPKDVNDYKATLPKYRSYYVEQLTHGSELVNRGNEFQKLALEFRNIKDVYLPQPENLCGVLREYQKTGYSWLSVLSRYGFGGILADDMGLGKTIQVIAFLLSVQTPGKQTLVVAPTSLIYNWDNEIARFAPSLTSQIISGQPEKRKELLEIPADIIITTYDLLKRDIDLYTNKSFETIIADEAQYIKNPQTQNARAVKAIKSKNRFALTGTPIENSLTELWSIFDFIMPGYLFSSHKFTRLYETPIVKSNDKKRAESLQKQIAPFLLRRLKRDVLTELPEKTETNLYAEMLPDQRRLYMAHLLKIQGTLEFNGGISRNRMKILAELTQLRQICCHPALFVEGYSHGSGKLSLALETIQMTVESGHRLLLFSQFTSMLSLIKDELNLAGFSFFYLDGSTSSADRIKMVDRFNKGERELFLISLKAGGTGLNLTGADVVIHYDPWWNPFVMDQASGRAHRFGQKQAVQVFNLLTRGTIEQRIMELHEKKKCLSDSVISEGEQFLGLMSDSEIMELFDVYTNEAYTSESYTRES